MAHSDALIFLTNITWVFLLFLFVYFFFVLFFLPTLYKKYRMRALIKTVHSLGGVLALRNVLVSLTFFVDFFCALNVIGASLISSGIFFFVSSVCFVSKLVVGDKSSVYADVVTSLTKVSLGKVFGDFTKERSPKYFSVRKN